MIHDIENTNLTYYIDGGFDSSHTINRGLNTNTNLTFAAREDGTSSGSSTTHYTGGIDDFAVWNRALDSNEVDSIYDVGVEKYEQIMMGLNDDVSGFNLGYTTSEIAQLVDIYSTQSGTAEIDGYTWNYLSGDLPGDIGGTTYEIGDSWTYNNKYYIKLGSGLEGVPEIPAGMMPFLVMGAMFVVRRSLLVARGRK